VRSCIEVRDECPRATSGSRAITFCPPRSGDRPVFGAGTSRHEVSRTALLAPYLNRTTSWIRHQASITKTASQQFKVRLCPGFQETHSHFECHLGSSLTPTQRSSHVLGQLIKVMSSTGISPSHESTQPVADPVNTSQGKLWRYPALASRPHGRSRRESRAPAICRALGSLLQWPQ
jgi:hypothetical protein